MKYCVFIVLFFAGFPTYAEENLYSYIGWMKDKNNDNFLLEVGAVEPINKYSFASTSLMNYQYNENLYTAANLSINVSFNSKITPYIGLGVFIGEYENCKNNYTTHEYCSNDFTGGFYPEVGFKISFNQLKIGSYARLYTAAHVELEMLGFYIGYEIGRSSRPF